MEGVLCPQADGFGNANYVNARELTCVKLYGFSSVSNLFSICGLSFFHGGHGGTRRGINDNVQWRVCCVRKRTGMWSGIAMNSQQCP